MKLQNAPADLVTALRGAVRSGVLTIGTPLAPLSRWRIGGAAAILVEPCGTEEAVEVLRIMATRTEPLFVMGDATNVLFDSCGFDGVIMRVGRKMSSFQVKGANARAQAGVWMPTFARAVGCRGLVGLEHTIGIPGTLGGLIAMNGGSQRRGIGANVTRVLCADRFGQLSEFSQAECAFGYRTSRFQEQGSVVLEADFEFEVDDPAAVRRRMIAILADRRRKFPKHLPNCGSTFLSDPSMYEVVGPPGRVIEEAGLKGMRVGGAEVSAQHANFIVNSGGATSDDVLGLISLIRNRVYESTGYLMDCEVRHVAPCGAVQPAHVVADARSPASWSGVPC